MANAHPVTSRMRGFILMGLLLVGTPAMAATFYVDHDATGTPADGSIWASAYRDIQSAVDAASDGDEIWVAAGVYTRDGDVNNVVEMKEGVRLYGGFEGDETQRNERDWIASETVIDGQSAIRCVLGVDNSTLDGFIIRNGARTRGAGMYNQESSPTVSNCTFTGNTASHYGGGMYNDNASSPIITDCIFNGNTADTNGGGMYDASYSSPRVMNCTFTGNTTGWWGGGMFNMGSSSPAVEKCVFNNNTALFGGGMVNCAMSSPTVMNCTFTGNTADTGGGGLFNYNSSSTIMNCMFIENAAGRGAGGILNINFSSTITNCAFIKNRTDGTGGGMSNATKSSPTLTNCTFAGNTANGDDDNNGSGMYNIEESSPTVTNCILWDKAGDEIFDSDASSHSVVSYSCVFGGYEGGGNISDAPLFIDAVNGNVQLSGDSPCIDTGMTDNAPEMDILGVSRPMGDGVDMGAYELEIGCSADPVWLFTEF